MTENSELEALYGPLAAHSEYTVGATVRYRRQSDGTIHTGEILWIVAAGETVQTFAGQQRQAPLSYIVAPDDGFVEVLYQHDILPPT